MCTGGYRSLQGCNQSGEKPSFFKLFKTRFISAPLLLCVTTHKKNTGIGRTYWIKSTYQSFCSLNVKITFPQSLFEIENGRKKDCRLIYLILFFFIRNAKLLKTKKVLNNFQFCIKIWKLNALITYINIGKWYKSKGLSYAHFLIAWSD